MDDLVLPTEQVLQPFVSGILCVTANFLNSEKKVKNYYHIGKEGKKANQWISDIDYE